MLNFLPFYTETQVYTPLLQLIGNFIPALFQPSVLFFGFIRSRDESHFVTENFDHVYIEEDADIEAEDKDKIVERRSTLLNYGR